MTARSGAIPALKCLLDLQLAIARLALAAQQRTADDRAAAVDLAVQAQQAAAASGAEVLHRRWDGAVHRGLLEHQGVLERRRELAASDCAQARAGVARATRRTLDIDRRLAMLQRLECRCQRMQGQEAKRAAAREADLLWLVQLAAAEVRAAGAGGAE